MMQPAFAAGTLHFKPDSNAIVSANHFLAVNGTSAPSNATRSNCTVSLQVNGHGYKPVTPVNGSYVKWSTFTAEMMKPGINVLEGQLMCTGFVHHLVHNVTGVP